MGGEDATKIYMQSANLRAILLLLLLFLTHYCAGDKIEKNEIGGAYSAYGGGERRVQGFGGKT
jgi:hypothetical protein